MVQWEGEKQVGLAPGQTGGYVDGTYVYRDPSSDISKPYIQAESIQTTSGYPGDRVLVEAGGQKFYTGRGEVPEIGSYRRETGFTSVRRTGMMTPAEIERQYQEQRGLQPTQQVPSPFQLGIIGYAPGSPFGTGYFTSPEYQKQYPTTPIDYSRTHVSELYSWPVYKGAAFVSRGLTRGLEYGIDIQPFPEPVREVQKGVGGLVTGIPEFFAAGLAGFEYAAREPTVFKEMAIPAVKMFGAGLVEQAKERPFYTLGQAAGMGIMLKGAPRVSGMERLRLTSGKPTPENVFFPERPGSLGKTPSLLTKSITERLKFPERERLPQRPAGTEGLELLKLPERPGISKPVVIEGVKTIREPSAIPEQYRAALEKGAAPFAERGVMGIRFGSKGYRPTGMAKPENIFRTGEFKRFLKEEKAVSYIPTFERARAEPQIKPKVQVITAEKTYVLPSLRTLQVAKTAPRTLFKVIALPKVSTKTSLKTDILVQTRPKTYTQAMTRTAIRTGISIKPTTKTMVMPSTMTRIKVSAMPAIQTRTAVKYLTQTMTKTKAMPHTMTMFDIGVKKITKTKTKGLYTNGKLKMAFGRGGFKYPELTRVATPRQIMKGFRL